MVEFFVVESEILLYNKKSLSERRRHCLAQPAKKPRIAPKKRKPSAQRKAQPRSKHFYPMLVLVIFLAAIGMVIIQYYDNAPLPEKEPVQPATMVATLTAVGDINITPELIDDALQTDGTYDFSSAFFDVAHLLHKSDLTLGNLELNFLGEPYGDYTASAPESLAITLRTLGFDILQTANSKTLAGGIKGLRSTLETVRAHGIDPVGSYASVGERTATNGVLIKEVNGIRIAFIALTKGFDGMSIPDGNEYCTNVLYTDYDSVYSKVDTEQIVTLIENAKAQEPDVIIALVHWGSEYRMTVSKTQKSIADLMFRYGVDAILGTHSHMAGPMEFRTVETVDGVEKEVFLAYSLGNFYGSDSTIYAQESMILNMEFTKDSDTGVTTITKADYIPIYLTDHGEGVQDRYQTQAIDLALDLYDQAFATKVPNTDVLTEAIETVEANTAPVVEEEDD